MSGEMTISISADNFKRFKELAGLNEKQSRLFFGLYSLNLGRGCFKLPKWNGFSLKSERRLLAPPSGFIPRKVLASKLGGGLNQRSP